MEKRRVYLDYAATTYLDKEVLKEMSPYFTDVFGNANSQHLFGRDAAKAVAEARVKIAEIIGSKPNEIYFTSGGTEADNWAIKGIAAAYEGLGKHIITSAVEHHAVLETCKALEKKGFEVTYVPVGSDGVLDLKAFENAIRDDTILVSIMYANNEIGTVMPIQEAVAIVKKQNHRIYFHTDCVQAAGALDIDVNKSGVDLMSVSAHKFYGPKGIGFLYIKNGVKLDKLISGGNQERKMRGGTLNVPHIVGMAKAFELASLHREKNNAHIQSLRDGFIDRILSEIDNVYLNGSREKRLPGNANLSFEYIEGESLLMSLDLEGIAASSGSACSSGSLDPSHVLLALGIKIELAHGSLRFSFGKSTTRKDVDYTVDCLKDIVNRLRAMSPLFYQLPSKKTNV
ncbi:MAG: cysteine desulfurase NifS [Clostridiales bacterium]|jgi:cysteine desulfurase|nr:cysteine desulfurase NifS [Clostridiales bacterium]